MGKGLGKSSFNCYVANKKSILRPAQGKQSLRAAFPEFFQALIIASYAICVY